ncbi:hypothetical protein GCM10027615_71730 [Plantactinospora veratri]
MRSRAWTATATAVAVVLVSGSGCATQPEAAVTTGTSGDGGAIYLDRSYSARERAVDLVSRMTLAEKAAQMISSQSAALPRLGIAAYGWWNEAGHGVAREGTLHNANPPVLVNTTSYPVDLSLGATWNPELVHREATLISDEAREVVRDNRLDLNFYAPTVNLARDPRWGRNDEAFSEDPLLTAALAAQFVNGMEGKDRSGRLLPESGGYLKTSTTLKHYAANNSEFDRLRGTANMDDRTLREYYTAQFREVVERSSPASIMTSYNRVNGVPTSASGYLMDELARQTFGFDGFFTSDCDSIREIQHGHRWQPPGHPAPLDHVERHAWANAAGEDLNCQQGHHDEWNYANAIPEAIARGIDTPYGRYTEEHVDASLVRLLTTRIRLGEFDRPEDVPWVTAARSRLAPGTWTNSDANGAVTQTPARLATAREVAAEGIVLLKNQGRGDRAGAGRSPLLPLRVPASGPYRVAVLGHYANPPTMYLGGYSSIQASAGQANEVNGYQGLRAAIQRINPGAVVDHLPGVTPGSLAEVDPASVAAAADYDAVIVYAGTDERHSREDVDRSTMALPGAQASLISQVAARNPNTVVYLEAVGQVDVAGFEGPYRRSCGVRTTGSARARRWPTYCSGPATRAGTCRSPGTGTPGSSRRSTTTRSGAATGAPGGRTCTSTARCRTRSATDSATASSATRGCGWTAGRWTRTAPSGSAWRSPTPAGCQVPRWCSSTSPPRVHRPAGNARPSGWPASRRSRYARSRPGGWSSGYPSPTSPSSTSVPAGTSSTRGRTRSRSDAPARTPTAGCGRW